VAGSNASKRTKILLKKKNLVLALVVRMLKYMMYILGRDFSLLSLHNL